MQIKDNLLIFDESIISELDFKNLENASKNEAKYGKKKSKFSLLLVLVSCCFFKANAKSFPAYKVEDSIAAVKVKKRSYPSKTEKENPFVATGSAIVITEDGYLLTSSSLVGESTNAVVIFDNKASFEATVVGRDLRTDLALLKIECKKLKPVTWAYSSQKGEDIWVIGAAYSANLAIVPSVLSADLRSNKMFEPVKNYVGNAFEYFTSDVIQYISTPASAKMHAAGLFDAEGACIGINTQIYDRFGLEGFGFAVPGNVACKVAYDLIKNGRVIRKHIGILLQEIDKKLFLAHKLDQLNAECSQNYGALIIDFKENSSAKKHGLKAQDIIISVNGTAIKNVEHLQNLILMNGDKKISVVIWRKNFGTLELNKNSELKKAESEKANSEKANSNSQLSQSKTTEPKISQENITVLKTTSDYQLLKFDVTLDDLPDAITEKNCVNESKYLEVQLIAMNKEDKLLHTLSSAHEKFEHGLFVAKIFDKKLKSMLEINDVILSAQGKEMRSLRDFDLAIADSLKKNEKYIILLVVRNGQVYSYAIELNELNIKKGKKNV